MYAKLKIILNDKINRNKNVIFILTYNLYIYIFKRKHMHNVQNKLKIFTSKFLLLIS
jgi:hypothetical protein